MCPTVSGGQVERGKIFSAPPTWTDEKEAAGGIEPPYEASQAPASRPLTRVFASAFVASSDDQAEAFDPEVSVQVFALTIRILVPPAPPTRDRPGRAERIMGGRGWHRHSLCASAHVPQIAHADRSAVLSISIHQLLARVGHRQKPAPRQSQQGLGQHVLSSTQGRPDGRWPPDIATMARP